MTKEQMAAELVDSPYGKYLKSFAPALAEWLLTRFPQIQELDVAALRERRDGIQFMLVDNIHLRESKHLDADTSERAYWHAGYQSALSDVLRKIGGCGDAAEWEQNKADGSSQATRYKSPPLDKEQPPTSEER